MASNQLQLPLKVAMSKEIDGLEMGVLSDGSVYLTGRSLARLCGVAASAVIQQAENWKEGKRDGQLAKMLKDAGFDDPLLYTPTVAEGKGGVHAYSEDVCMIFLEYYAMDVQRPQARTAYRTLARAGLRAFVYSALGYDPTKVVPDVWRQFHDRLTLVSSPVGYFSVFREMAEFVVGTIRGGLRVDEHTIPDISVGQAWSSHWKNEGLDGKFGERAKFDHNYPDYFPQAASNPQEMWVYPVSALGEFRIWLQRTYVQEKFPKYLSGKVSKGVLPASTAELLIDSVAEPELLTDGDDT